MDSNKSRGQRAKRQLSAPATNGTPARPPTARQSRQGWAPLIRQVYESDPLCCPKRRSKMKIIASTEPRQTEVIEKVLLPREISLSRLAYVVPYSIFLVGTPLASYLLTGSEKQIPISYSRDCATQLLVFLPPHTPDR